MNWHRSPDGDFLPCVKRRRTSKSSGHEAVSFCWDREVWKKRRNGEMKSKSKSVFGGDIMEMKLGKTEIEY